MREEQVASLEVRVPKESLDHKYIYIQEAVRIEASGRGGKFIPQEFSHHEQ